MILEALMLVSALRSVAGDQLPPTRASIAGGPGTVDAHVVEAADEILQPRLAELGLSLGEPVVSHGKGTWHLLYPQVAGGRPVHDAWLKLSLRHAPGGGFVVTSASGSLAESLRGVDSLATTEISSAQAEVTARAEAAAWKPAPPATIKDVRGTRLEVDPASGEPAWRTVVRGEDPIVALEMLISAVDGRVLSVRDLVQGAMGQGHIFTPNPVVELDDVTLRDDANAGGAVPMDAYVTGSLPDLQPGADGRYLLRGPNVIMADLKSPTDAQAAELNASSFNYSRDDPRFEQVNAYFHVDALARYVHGLGFTDAMARPVTVDAHATTSDQSYYDPTDHSLNFGDGGVDDAEDADIIVHEAGHALQDSIVPNFGAGAEAGSISEGTSDYLAATRREIGGVYEACVGSWDATAYDTRNPPCLRRVDTPKKYPADLRHEIHADGEIWSAALWAIRQRIGADKADRLVIQAFYHLGPDATFHDAALALVQADADLGLGARGAICDATSSRGLVTEAECPVDLQVADAVIDDSVGGDGDGQLEPGETASIVLRLRNNGPATMTGGTTLLQPRDPSLIQVARSAASYPDVPSGAVVAPTGLPQSVTVPATDPCGTSLVFDVPVHAAGYDFTDHVTIRVGQVVDMGTLIDSALDTPAPIPDNNYDSATHVSGPLVSSIHVDGAGTVASLSVSADIAHPYRGDLTVVLTSPSGRRLTLQNRTGGSADDLVTTWPDVSSVAGPGSFADFAGEPVTGDWKLTVGDWSAQDAGTLRSWSLSVRSERVDCSQSGTCVGAAMASSDVRVRKGSGGRIVLTYPAPVSSCALGARVRMAAAVRPSQGLGHFPEDPAFGDVTSQDVDPGAAFAHVPPAGVEYYLVVEDLPGGRVGPSGSYGW